MLFTSKRLFNRPVMSLRLGARIATAVEPVIDPHNLKIIGWWCLEIGQSGHSILLAEDVREVMPDGLAVNDEETLTHPDELARHREILQIHFQLIGKTVKTKRGKLGKVNDFSYNDGLFVQKLYVERPLIKVFASESILIIDRTQIIEVTDDYILVKDTEVPSAAAEEASAATAIAS